MYEQIDWCPLSPSSTNPPNFGIPALKAPADCGGNGGAIFKTAPSEAPTLVPTTWQMAPRNLVLLPLRPADTEKFWGGRGWQKLEIAATVY